MINFCFTFLFNFRPCIIFTIESSNITVVFGVLFYRLFSNSVYCNFSFTSWWKILSVTSSVGPSISLVAAKAWIKFVNLIFIVSLPFLVFLDILKVLLYSIMIPAEGKWLLLPFTSAVYCMFPSSSFRKSRFFFSFRFYIIMLLFLSSSRRKSYFIEKCIWSKKKFCQCKLYT